MMSRQLSCSLRRASTVALVTVAGVTDGAHAQRCAPDNAGLTLPPSFCALVVAEGLGVARHIAVAPNGDLFLALLDHGGPTGMLLLRDTTGDGVADVRVRVVDDSTVAYVRLWTVAGGTYLYYSSYNDIVRIPWRAGRLMPRSRPDTVLRGLPGVRQHGIKSMAFAPPNRLYVNIGAPSNSCQLVDRQPRSPGMDPCPLLDSTGGIWLFDASRSRQRLADGERFATGLRNTMALAVRPETYELYGVVHGRDELSRLWGYSDSTNAEKPSEEFVHIKRGDHFGWPYCYHDPEEDLKVLAPEYGGDGRALGRCANAKKPLIGFPAHWAPNGLHFYTGSLFPERYRGGAFIAFHGSWNRAPLPQAGYNVVFVEFDGDRPIRWEIFADGFRPPGTRVFGRPVDVTEGPDGSLYIADSHSGRVYRILYTGSR